MKLRNAISSPTHLDRPSPRLPQAAHQGCAPDLTQCPRGWSRHGNVCVQQSDSQGSGNTCSQRYALAAMSNRQKEALGRHCGWTFPCQSDNCSIDLDEACPNSWQETSFENCVAPASYVGHCGRELNVTGTLETTACILFAMGFRLTGRNDSR